MFGQNLMTGFGILGLAISILPLVIALAVLLFVFLRNCRSQPIRDAFRKSVKDLTPLLALLIIISLFGIFGYLMV